MCTMLSLVLAWHKHPSALAFFNSAENKKQISGPTDWLNQYRVSWATKWGCRWHNTRQNHGIIVPLTISPLGLMFLVLRSVFTVNLCTFYFGRLIDRETDLYFWKVREFNFRNPTSSINVVWCSPHTSSLRSTSSSPRMDHHVLT